jgi:Raf kinase inhibitor-like YbhB/YbcL family protein
MSLVSFVKKIRTLAIFAAMAVPCVGMAVLAQSPPAAAPRPPGLSLTTPAFEDGSIIPPKFTQAVDTPISPKLQWTNVPENTASFTLIVRDPDGAPEKKVADVLHWMVFNIPGSARELPEAIASVAQLPDGTIQAKNTRGGVGYRGPGAGAAGPYHHYTFELYALDAKLDLGPDATRADVLKAMDGHIVGKAALIGRFHR